MMKNIKHIIPIGDVHGRTMWTWALNNKFIGNKLEDTMLVFLGDYVDSFTVSNDVVIQNLTNIIQLKKDYPNNVTLLLGNHDIQYYYAPNNSRYVCSGHRPEMEKTLADLFQTNKDLFQVCFKHEDMLFTHAGVSTQWISDNRYTLCGMYNLKQDYSNIDEVLNAVHISPYNYLLHTIGAARKSDPTNMSFGGITWADKSETEYDFIPGIHQFVGHTHLDKIETCVSDYKDGSITYCDVLRDSNDDLPVGEDGNDPLFHSIKLN